MRMLVDKQYFTIDQLSEYLSIKKSTLYSKVGSGEIPFYKIGRLIRFRKDDVDRWMDSLKSEVLNPQKTAKRIIKKYNKNNKVDIDGIVKKSIEQIKQVRYNPIHGRPDRIKGLREEVPNGSL